MAAERSPFHASVTARLAGAPADRDAHQKARRSSDQAERQLRKGRRRMLGDWSHKNEGTAETHAHHAEAERRRNKGALARLYASGAIDAEQLGYAEEIGNVAEYLEADVAVRTASMETKVDTSRSNDGAIAEGLNWVRMQIAYTRWRSLIPAPKRAVLDMITGERVGFTVVAKRYRIHNRKAKRMLIAAIDLWPDCRAFARTQINHAELEAMKAGLMA